MLTEESGCQLKITPYLGKVCSHAEEKSVGMHRVSTRGLCGSIAVNGTDDNNAAVNASLPRSDFSNFTNHSLPSAVANAQKRGDTDMGKGELY